MLKRLLFGGSSCTCGANCGMLMLRVFTGLFLALGHGRFKFPPDGITKMTGFLTSLNVPAPHAAAWASMLAEFGGGFLLALGLGTRPVAAIIAFNMLVAIMTAHLHTPIFMQVANGGPSMEPALLYMVPALFFMFAGSGRYGVDALIAPRSGKSAAGFPVDR